MSKKQKRIEIAKDVIKSLKARKIFVANGIYFRTATISPSQEGRQLCDIMKDRVCEVCAKGALFIAAVNRYDNYLFDTRKTYSSGSSGDAYTSISGNSVENRLKEEFSEDQLDLIEFAFEVGYSVEGECVKGDDKHSKLEYLRAAVTFGLQYSSPEDRMVAIMKNIIANEGTFVVKPKKTDATISERLERIYREESPFYSDAERLANS